MFLSSDYTCNQYLHVQIFMVILNLWLYLNMVDSASLSFVFNAVGRLSTWSIMVYIATQKFATSCITTVSDTTWELRMWVTAIRQSKWSRISCFFVWYLDTLPLQWSLKTISQYISCFFVWYLDTLPWQWSLITTFQENHSFHPMFPAGVRNIPW